jgi:uncharacterized cupredoxin-like copper-binding protein
MAGVFGTVLAMMLVAGAAFAHDSKDAGRPGRAADVARTVSVTADDTSFSVKAVNVHPGETVRFVVTNIGKIDHEFSVATHAEHGEHRQMMAEMPDMKHTDRNMVTLKPGQTKNLIWKFGAARSDLEFSCDIPGHAEAGMLGKFVFAK